MPLFIDESRKVWRTSGEKATDQEIRTGCFQRIAFSLETMAQGWTALEHDRDMYLRWYKEEQARTAKLRSQIRGLKGVITRMKKERE